MLHLTWTEFALFGVVALVLFGPKDLPTAVKTVAASINRGGRGR